MNKIRNKIIEHMINMINNSRETQVRGAIARGDSEIKFLNEFTGITEVYILDDWRVDAN